jgi:type I restriction enzyme, R subunit
MITPEARARQQIDDALEQAGWRVQNHDEINLFAGRGIAVREFPLLPGHGSADYLLFVDGVAVGVVEAKPDGTTLTGVELQSSKYSEGLPATVRAIVTPLPFQYQATGNDVRFSSGLDPEPRSRRVFSFHRPETLASWLETGQAISAAGDLRQISDQRETYDAGRATLRRRLQHLPPLDESGLWPAQIRAVRNLEASLKADRPRALIQMATGSGKTFTAITSIYRLVKHGGATRVLFLVDRANLGRQALKEFQQYTTPDDGRKFTELYNVQLLTTNRIDPVARVCITTIQRLYSMLRGDEELDPTLEEGSQFDTAAGLLREPAPVEYNPAIPVETFDVIFTDEAHRSIYNLWRQVLEYFDAYLIGLTATPSKQTFGFFNQNLVMEYTHPQAVADGVNVDYNVYKIRTRITEEGSTVDAGLDVERRDRRSGVRRWEELEEEFIYDPTQLDRQVVSMGQIRTVIRTFKEKLFTEIFPGRTEVPKTLVYAKDDRHADDIVQVVREEFGRGNEFCWKITYRTTGRSPEDLLQSFRNSYYPRIIVTVDMIATGTDIKPLEIVMFMRAVKSRNFFEQMKGRGVRVINDADFRSVTSDALSKTHFVLIDCVGVTEMAHTDAPSLDRKPTTSLKRLLQAVAYGSADEEVVSTVASRLARIERQINDRDRETIAAASGGQTLRELIGEMVGATDPERQALAARERFDLPPDAEPTEEQITQAAGSLLQQAVMPLASNPELRTCILDLQQRYEQLIDAFSQDEVTVAEYSPEARDRDEQTVRSFERFIEENRDEITALQLLYNQPYARRLTYGDVRALADAIQSPPRSWTVERLWQAYERLDKSRVGGSGKRILTDIVSLVRFAIHQEDELVPFPDLVHQRFDRWLATQENAGRRFTAEQRQWLEMIRDQIAGSLSINPDDFEYAPFSQHGGLGKAYQVFGEDLGSLLDELNRELAA